MSLTPSHMIELDSRAPDFSLSDTEGRVVSLSDFADSNGLVVAFMCNHCPYVKHIRHSLAEFAHRNASSGIGFVGINANDMHSHPADSPENMREEARSAGYTFPYLHDESQNVAKAYQAACTPDFFLYDGDRRLVYRGQFDGSRPGNRVEVTGKDLQSAIDALLNGNPPLEKQSPSVGCNIKWKPGNEPEIAA